MSTLLWNRADHPSAVLLLAHGAGAPMDSPFMAALADKLARRRISVARFEFPYMDRRRREGVKAPPDRAPKLLAHFDAVIDRVAALEPDLPLWVGGKSMGGRMATLIAAGQSRARAAPGGALVFGYPFHPPGKPDKTRLAHFPDIAVPVLICQGERDPFGTRERVSGYTLPDRVTMAWIADGDHDLGPRKRSGHDQDSNLESAADRAAAFLGL